MRQMEYLFVSEMPKGLCLNDVVGSRKCVWTVCFGKAKKLTCK